MEAATNEFERPRCSSNFAWTVKNEWAAEWETENSRPTMKGEIILQNTTGVPTCLTIRCPEAEMSADSSNEGQTGQPRHAQN